MSTEKPNDFNDVQSASAAPSEPLHPPVSSADMCWCGNEPMHQRGPKCDFLDRVNGGADRANGVALAERNPLCVCRCAVPTILYDGRQWCDRCVPRPMTKGAHGIHSVPIRDDSAAIRELIPALTKSVNRLCAILETLASYGGRLTLTALDRTAAEQPPIASGDRIIYKGRRGMVRSVGAAGTGVLFDDGRYELLLAEQAARLVRG